MAALSGTKKCVLIFFLHIKGDPIKSFLKHVEGLTRVKWIKLCGKSSIIVFGEHFFWSLAVCLPEMPFEWPVLKLGNMHSHQATAKQVYSLGSEQKSF